MATAREFAASARGDRCLLVPDTWLSCQPANLVAALEDELSVTGRRRKVPIQPAHLATMSADCTTLVPEMSFTLSAKQTLPLHDTEEITACSVRTFPYDGLNL